jgi:hypothetical protein
MGTLASELFDCREIYPLDRRQAADLNSVAGKCVIPAGYQTLVILPTVGHLVELFHLMKL